MAASYPLERARTCRMHSAVGLPVWREVPEGGMEIAGHFLEQGDNVGINPWAAHYNEQVFGDDAHCFRPERWIESSPEKLSEMESYWITVSQRFKQKWLQTLTLAQFGSGNRSCVGRHISWLEISKLIPQLVRDFDFEFQAGELKWKTQNVWFVKVFDFVVRAKKRDQ